MATDTLDALIEREYANANAKPDADLDSLIEQMYASASSRELPSAGIAQPGDVIASLGPGGRRAPDQYAAAPDYVPGPPFREDVPYTPPTPTVNAIGVPTPAELQQMRVQDQMNAQRIPAPDVPMTRGQAFGTSLGNAAAQGLIATEQGYRDLIRVLGGDASLLDMATGQVRPEQQGDFVHQVTGGPPAAAQLMGLDPTDLEGMQAASQQAASQYPITSAAGGIAAMPYGMAEPKALAMMVIGEQPLGVVLQSPLTQRALGAIAAKFGPRVAAATEAQIHSVVSNAAFGGAMGAANGEDLSGVLSEAAKGGVLGAVLGVPGAVMRGARAGRREMSPAATRDVAPESGVSQPLPEPTAESAASTPAGTRAGSPVPGSDTPAGVSDAMTQDGSVPASPAGTIEDVQAFARIKQQRDAIRQAAADLDARIASALGLQPGTDVGAVLDRATTKAEPSKGGAPAREPSPADVVLNEARIIRAREDQRAGRTSQAAPRTTDPTAQGEIPPVVDAAQTSQRAGESTTSRLADRTGPAEGNTTRGGVEPNAASTDVTSEPARTKPPEQTKNTEVSNGQEEGRPQGLLNDKSAPSGTASAGVEVSKSAEVPPLSDRGDDVYEFKSDTTGWSGPERRFRAALEKKAANLDATAEDYAKIPDSQGGKTGPAKEGLSQASQESRDSNPQPPKLKSPPEIASKVEKAGEPKTLEQRLLDFADRMKQERAQTPDPRRGGSKPGQRTGNAPIFKDTVTLAAELAARAAAKGIQAAKAVHAFVHEQMGAKDGDPEARRVTRIVRGILSDSVKDGKVDYDAFEYAANAAREAATKPAKVSVSTVREATGQAPESRSVTERAALRASMKAAARGSREGFKAGKAEGVEQQAARTVREVERTRRTVARQDRETARRELRVLSEQLTDAAKRRESMQSIEQRGAVESARADEKGKAATAQGLRDEAIRMIEEYAPPNERGKYIRAANKATTFGRLGSLVERLRSDMETREIRRGLRAADRAIGSETDKLELDKELRDQLQTAIGTVERIRRRFQAKTGPARSARELLGTAGTEVPARLRGPTADEIAVLRDDLSNAINSILGVRHEQKTLDRVRVKGEEVEASVIRREVNDRLSTRKEIPAGDVPDARDRGWFRRSIARRTNMRAMMTALDGGKSGGPGRRIFGRMLDARSKSLALQHSFEDGLSEIVTRNGYANLGRWSAEWGGTLNKGAQKMVDVAFGPFKKLTMDQAAYLYASWGDEGFRSRIRAGQEIQFRAAPTEKPISVGPADFERLAKAIPENVRKIIDESKALYDRTYFDRLSDVNKKMRGYHLDKTEGYWGIKLNRSFTEGRGTPQSWRRAFIRSLEESGFMQEREGPSKSPILIGDFSHDIIGRSRAAATTIGKAETVKLLARVFLHPDTVPEMTAKFGKSFVERMERRISEWSGGETPRTEADTAFRMALGLWARGKTQLWVPTWARNVVGGAVRLMDILPASSVLKSVAGVTPERFKELRAYSPEMRERFDAGGLGAYMHGSASGSSGGLRPVAASHLKDGLRGTLAGLGETISAMSKMNPGEAREALRGVGRSWESFLDAMSIGNFFDGASAMMAYDHFLRAAPEKYVGERRKQWAATRAARAFERISNTATIEYANDVQLDARQSGLLAMLMPFTGDTAKAQSMIAESAMTGKLGRTAAVLGVGAIASGLVSSLWGSAKGEKTEDAAAAGATRVGQELVSLIPGVGNVMSNLIPAATGQAPRDSAALETPLASLATDAIQATGNVLDGLKAMNERSATRREKYKALALRGFGGLADAAGSAAGLPTGYVQFSRKAFANWSGQNENNAAKLVSAFNRSSGRTGEVASQKRDARADLWLAIRQDNPEAAAAALEDLSHAGVRFTNQMLLDLQRDRHPLNDIPLRDRRKFLSSLSDEQRKAIDAAIAEHTAAVNRSSTVIRQARGKQTASK